MYMKKGGEGEERDREEGWWEEGGWIIVRNLQCANTRNKDK